MCSVESVETTVRGNRLDGRSPICGNEDVTNHILLIHNLIPFYATSPIIVIEISKQLTLTDLIICIYKCIHVASQKIDRGPVKATAGVIKRISQYLFDWK